MNKVILMGRLTRDPDVRNSSGENPVAVARYTLAVDRKYSRRDDSGDGQSTDYIGCVAFGKGAEFAGKYLRQGIKIAVTGRIQTGSYTNRDGQKVFTTDVVVEEQEFAESKAASPENRPADHVQNGRGRRGSAPDASGFMNIPEGSDYDLPFE